MEEGYKIEEFHCASNTCQPVHLSSQDNACAHPSSFFHNKVHNEQYFEDRRKAFTKGRSSTMYSSSRRIVKTSKGITPDLRSKGDMIEKSTFLFRCSEDVLEQSPTAEETKNLMAFPTKAFSANIQFKESLEGSNRRSTTDSESTKADSAPSQTGSFMQMVLLPAMNSEQQLKEKLTDSLSPSPFRNEDPGKREVKLAQLVASAPCTTKSILFSKFYGSELGANDSRAWKIALKDHIVHTLESICLIKKLKPVPSHIIEKKKLPFEPKSSSKYMQFIMNREKTFSFRP